MMSEKPSNSFEEFSSHAPEVSLESKFSKLENLDVTITGVEHKLSQGLIPENELESFLDSVSKYKDALARAILNPDQREQALVRLQYLLSMEVVIGDKYQEDNYEEDVALRAKDHIETKIKEVTMALVEKVQPAIEKSRQEIPDGFNDQLMLDLYQALILYGNNKEQRVKGTHFLSAHIDIIGEGINKQNWREYIGYARDIIEYSENQNKEELAKIMSNCILESVDQDKSEALFLFLLQSRETADFAFDVADVELGRMGLSGKKLFEAWRVTTNSERTFHLGFIKNLDQIKEVESVEPGSVKFLYETFGIADFARYPKEILLDMVKNYDNKEKPYGLIMYPRNDWNGAFYNDKGIFMDLYNQLEGDFLLRVAECDNKTELARMLIKLDKQYNPKDGSGHKISLLILGGHGTKDSIRFGGQDDRHALHVEDFMGKGVRKTSKFFDDNPTIILHSCSTGTEKGIGQELSKVMGAKVIAPKVPTSIYSLDAKKEGERFVFHVEFEKQEEKNSYDRGELI